MTEKFDTLRALRGGYEESVGEDKCAKHGAYPLRIFHLNGEQIGHFPSRCMACSKEESDEYDRREKIADIKARIVDAGVPDRFTDSSFSGYEHVPGSATAFAEIQTYAKSLAEGDTSGRSRILLGNPGTGKTHLAIATLRAVIASGSYGRYTTVADMIRHIRSTWNRRSGGESEISVIRAYAECRLLVMDEVGVSQTGSDNEVGLIADVIDQRYRARRPTVVIGNLTITELSKYLGERVVDRLIDNGGQVLTFDWSSYRKTRAA